MSKYNYCGECIHFQTTLWLPMNVITHKCLAGVDCGALDKESPACQPYFVPKEDKK